MFQTKVVEKINTQSVFSNFFENRAVYEIMWKEHCRAGQAVDDNMAQAHYMLDN
jgi:urease gamma subunit